MNAEQKKNLKKATKKVLEAAAVAGKTPKKAASAPETPAAPAGVREYPKPEDFTREDLKSLQEEYNELRGLETPTDEQKARAETLKVLGRTVNKIMTDRKAGGQVAPLAAKGKAVKKEVSEEDLKALATEMNAVMALEPQLNLELTAAELATAMKAELKELRPDDFESKDDPTKAVFTEAAKHTIQDLGFKVPLEGEKATKKASKAPKAPIIPYLESLIDEGTHTRKDLREALEKEFPGRSPASYATYITDGFNPKYARFSEKKVAKMKGDKVTF